MTVAVSACRSGAWLGRRGRVLTWLWRAPQNGWTALWNAAYRGHQEVVQLLVQAGADKDAPGKVTREGVRYGAHKRCLLFLLGVAARLLTVSVLMRVGEPCDCQWTGIAVVGLCARSGAGAIF